MRRADALEQLTASGGRFAVTEEIVDGRPTAVFRDRLPHLRAIAEIAQRRGDGRTFLVSGTERYGFATFVATASGAGAAMVERLGLAPGERVAVLAQNSTAWCLAAWATIDVGSVLVGLNGWWRGEEILYGLQDSGACILVADRKRIERVAGLLDQCPALRAVVLTDCDPADVALPAGLTAVRFAELTARPTATLPDTPIAEDDPAIILYTSGTTGRPKGAVSTHRNVIAGLQLGALNAQASALAARTADGTPAAERERPAQLVSLFTSPLFHVSGCQGILISGLLTGMRLVLVEGRITAEGCLEAIERERVTLWATVPTLVWRVCSATPERRHDLTSVTRVVFGGSPAAAELQRLVRGTFPNVAAGAATNNYGLTETSGVIASLVPEEAAAKPGSVGRPLPTVAVRIVADDGTELPAGADGEITVRGAMVTPGYWGRPDATADAIRDGWLHTGDVGHLDADGYLTITDRKKDMIIRGGENVYCVEIEHRLLEHPAILDAAVIGVPHAELGEEVKAIVQVADGHALDAEAVRSWVREALADFKVPAHVELRSGPLPRNATGKLVKAELRDAVAAPR